MKQFNQIQASDLVGFIKKIPLKTWLMMAAGFLAFGVFIYFIFIPAWITRIHLRRQIVDIKKNIAATQNLLKKQPELIKNKENFLKISREVKGRLYQPGEASLLLGAISKIAEESNVSMVASSPKSYEEKFPEPFNAQYEGSSYQFTVEGGYHDLAVFASKIESNDKLLRVQNFSLIPQSKSADKHLAEMNLSAVSIKPYREPKITPVPVKKTTKAAKR